MKTTIKCLLYVLIPSVLMAQNEPVPFGALPSKRQLQWHEMEAYALIHYTPTTFQNKEWGFGDADPKKFDPKKFDADQIIKAVVSAGFKGVISVAKHHDGFCLWPTVTTEYSVKNSPWKSGKGDMVKEFMLAAHKNGIKFGVYLSAWDRNDPRYGSAAYTDIYRVQLAELTKNYGNLFISWHDGANGGDGYYGGANEKRVINRSTYYAWNEKTWPIVRNNQPNAVIFSDVGPDVRWVGNEHGYADSTSWSTFTPIGLDGRPPVPGDSDYSQSPSGTRNGKYWMPAECDVPLRDGWFYHKDQDIKVKTPDKLFEIYLRSVGYGANMNLGLAPMPEGRLHQNDIQSLAAFGHKVRETFMNNLASEATVQVSNLRENSSKFKGNLIIDNDRYSYYASDDSVLTPKLEITLKNEQEFDLIRLRENIKLGQRLDSVVIDIFRDGKWTRLASATSIGANRIIKLENVVKTSKLRINLFAPVAPTLSDFGLFKEYKETFKFDFRGKQPERFALDEFIIKTGLGLPKSLDENVSTFETINSLTDGVVFELKSPCSAISYLPRQDGETGGTVLKYEILVSQDNITWRGIKEGEFSNIIANPTEQLIEFDFPLAEKYLKFLPKETIGKTFTVATFRLFK